MTTTTTRNKTWSWTDEVLPFVAMLLITCLDMSVLTIVKAAMNGGMNSFVYIVYHDALGTLILFPFFIIHTFRNVGRPPLTFRILFRFFVLGLLGLCLFQVLVYIGIGYSSPTMASAIANLTPGNTFLIAVAFGMEKIDIKSSSSRAKLFGTIVAITGAMVFTFYKGPEIFNMISSSDYSPNHRLLFSQASDWIFGGLILVIGGIVGSIWNVLQGVFSTAFRSSAVIWCLKKKGPVFVAMFNPLSIVIASTMGVIFLGDSLHLGSAIGAVIVAGGFYTVMWGQAKQKKMETNILDGADEPGSSNPTTPLLSSVNESKC